MTFTTMHGQCRQALDNPYLPNDVRARRRRDLNRPDVAYIRSDDMQLSVGGPYPDDTMQVALEEDRFEAYAIMPVTDMRRLAQWILNHTNNQGANE